MKKTKLKVITVIGFFTGYASLYSADTIITALAQQATSAIVGMVAEGVEPPVARNNMVENCLGEDAVFPVDVVIENVKTRSPLSAKEKDRAQEANKPTGCLYPSVSFIEERSLAIHSDLVSLIEELRTSRDGVYFILKKKEYKVVCSYDCATGKMINHRK